MKEAVYKKLFENKEAVFIQFFENKETMLETLLFI